MASTAELARRIAALESKLAAVERSNRLNWSSVLREDGSSVSVTPALVAGTEAAVTAADALEQVVTAQATADGRVTVFYNDADDPPTEERDDPEYGDQWVRRTTLGGAVQRDLLMYDGDSWELVQDQAQVLAALIAAENAQDTADGKIVTYWTETMPSTGSPGDLWYRIAGTEATNPGAVLDQWRYNLGTGWTLLPLGAVQSPSYVPAEQGWAWMDGVAQVDNLNVIEVMGAETVRTENLLVNGMDMMDDILGPQPDGLLLYSRLGSSSLTHAGNADSTETILVEVAAGNIRAGRIYNVHVKGHFQATAVDTGWDLRIRYTTDGSDPTTSSACMDGSLTRVNTGSGTLVSTAFDVQAYYPPVSNYAVVRMALSARQVLGPSAEMWITLTDPDRALQFVTVDLGEWLVPLGASISQRKKGGGNPPTTGLGSDPDPVVRSFVQFSSTWVRTYAASYNTASGDPQEAKQGSSSNYRALLGFDYAAIQAALAGATVSDCMLSFRVKRTRQTTGTDFAFGTHSLTDKPATWPPAQVTPKRLTRSANRAGATYQLSLGSTIGTEFKNGTTLGIAVGPLPYPESSFTNMAFEGAIYASPWLTFVYTR